jgi:hypothetical protein
LPKTLIDESIKPIKIFLSYAHRDDEYRQELMVQEQAQTARAIPVIIRYCDWQPTPLGKLQALPRDGRPVKVGN